MPIRPGINLQARQADLTSVLPLFQEAREFQQRRALMPLQEQALQQRVDTGQVVLDEQRRAALTKSVVEGAAMVKPHIDRGDIQGAMQQLLQRRSQLEARGIDTSNTNEAIQLLQTDPEQFANSMNTLVEFGFRSGILNRAVGTVPAEIQAFGALTQNLPEEEVERARRIKLGLEPRAVGSSDITTATTAGLTEEVAGSREVIKEAEGRGGEAGKLTAQLKLKPMVQAAIKEAESQAAARGETLTALARSEAALPGLEATVTELKRLAPLATSTLTGRAFNTIAKELGFGATEGATARARFIAVVNNQVLPLLKETFGAAFTAQEGEALKATMGDPNASPEEKIAQLDAFIAQKHRDIQTKQTELDLTGDLPAGVTEEDIEFTMRQHGLSRQEVLQRLQ